jgi:hypothetical protein
VGFTEEYLMRCWRGRSLWRGKPAKPGDWYLIGDPLRLELVVVQEPGKAVFAAADIAYVPDADDLLELLDNQVRAAGGCPARKSLTIKYDAEGLWNLDVEYADSSTHVRKQESIHSLLIYAFFGMAQRIE